MTISREEKKGANGVIATVCQLAFPFN